MGIISIGKVPRIGRGQPVEFILMLRPDLKADKLIKSRRINAKTGEGKEFQILRKPVGHVVSAGGGLETPVYFRGIGR